MSKKSQIRSASWRTADQKNSRLAVFVIFLFVLIDIFLIIWYQKTNKNSSDNVLNQSPKTIFNSSPQTSVRRSSDGTMTLFMKTENAANSGKKYSFSVLDPASNNEQFIYSKTMNSPDSISIPDNSWSPDNKSLFLQVNEANALTFLVLKATGEPFSQGQEYLNIGELFLKKLPKYVLVNATGWASSTLIIVETKTLVGEKGSSFWFDVTSSSFIQLAS